MTAQAWPDWYMTAGTSMRCCSASSFWTSTLKCVRGRLFTVDGLIEDEGQIRQSHSGGKSPEC